MDCTTVLDDWFALHQPSVLGAVHEATDAARVDIVGSGQGSVPASGIVAELPALAAEITAGTFAVSPVPTPLSRVRAAWSAPTVPGQLDPMAWVDPARADPRHGV